MDDLTEPTVCAYECPYNEAGHGIVTDHDFVLQVGCASLDVERLTEALRSAGYGVGRRLDVERLVAEYERLSRE